MFDRLGHSLQDCQAAAATTVKLIQTSLSETYATHTIHVVYISCSSYCSCSLLDALLTLPAWLQSFVGDFSTVLDPSKNSGLNSSIYAFLTAAFVLSGLSYQFAPIQTLTAIFGTSAGKGLEDVYLWQLLGGGLATSVGPIAYTQRVSLSMRRMSVPMCMQS